jgi:hypothetical protein
MSFSHKGRLSSKEKKKGQKKGIKVERKDSVPKQKKVFPTQRKKDKRKQVVEEEDVPPKLESSSKDSPFGLPWEDVERVGSHPRKYLHPYKKLWDHKT